MPTRTVTLRVNGTPHELTVEERALLVDVVREAVGLTGTKVGCYGGDCGACTLMVDGQIRKSCLLLAASVDGADITTLEHSSGDELDPIRQAFWDEDAFQCGFCLAGFVFAARDLLASNPDPSEEEIRDAFVGNYCRCTGYVNFVEATREAARRLRAGAA
jgi:aerobic-type carbon monoxide dehydrogenase small subunit (CoxS/CutS family)